MSHDVRDSVLETLLRPVRWLPGDLLITMAVAVLAPVAALVAPAPIAALVALPIVLFLPGYALLAALVPQAYREAGRSRARRQVRGLTLGERTALAFGVSLLLLPTVGMVLVTVAAPLETEFVLESLAGFTMVMAIIGIVQRLRLPREERFHLPYRAWRTAVRGGLGREQPLLDRGLNLGVVLVAIVAMSLLVYGAVVPTPGASFTEFAVVTERPDGTLVAANYPDSFVEGEEQALVLTITNHEGAAQEYTVVSAIERVSASGELIEQTELERRTLTVADDAEARELISVAPTRSGEDLRLSFYLYAGAPPATATPDSADEHVFIWIDVAPTG